MFVTVFAEDGAEVHVGMGAPVHVSQDELEFAVTEYWATNLIGVALRLMGVVVMHGNAVVAGGRGVLWLGSKGAGKSTLTAAFVSAGYALLADDQVVIFDSGRAEVAYALHRGVQRARLWMQSLAAVQAEPDAPGIAFPYGSSLKGFLDGRQLNPHVATPASVPLAAVLLLEPRVTGLAAARIEQTSEPEGLVGLMQGRLGVIQMQIPKHQNEREFGFFGKLCRNVPVYRVTLPDDMDALPQAVDAIVDLVGALPGSSADGGVGVPKRCNR